MRFLSQHILPSLLIFSFSCVAAPATIVSSTRSIAPDQPIVNCTSSAAASAPNAACWNQLDLTKYLTDPLTGWNKTTPTCATVNPDGSSCCYPHEFWANCFLRLATGSQQACYAPIAEDTQCATLMNFPLSPSIGPSIAQQVRYVFHTIQNIDNFFLYYSSSKSYSKNISRLSSGEAIADSRSLQLSLTPYRRPSICWVSTRTYSQLSIQTCVHFSTSTILWPRSMSACLS